jgi:hypothetical protein
MSGFLTTCANAIKGKLNPSSTNETSTNDTKYTLTEEKICTCQGQALSCKCELYYVYRSDGIVNRFDDSPAIFNTRREMWMKNGEIYRRTKYPVICYIGVVSEEMKKMARKTNECELIDREINLKGVAYTMKSGLYGFSKSLIVTRKK